MWKSSFEGSVYYISRIWLEFSFLRERRRKCETNAWPARFSTLGPRVLRSSIKSPLSRNNYRGYRPCWITAKSTRPIYPNGKRHASTPITHPSGWISSWLFTPDNVLPAFPFFSYIYICENYLFFVYYFFSFYS